MLDHSRIAAAVQALATAHRMHEPLAALPRDSRPANLAEAYQIQAAYAQAASSPVSGYKVGAASKQSQILVGATGPFLARVFAETTFSSPARIPKGLLFTPGVEAELAFRIGHDLEPHRSGYAREEVVEAIDAVYPAIEICDNRFTDWRQVDLMQIIADNGFYGALVLGEPVADWRECNLPQCHAAMAIDGVTRQEGICASVLGDPLDGVIWIANELAAQGVGLKEGDVLAIGTWTGLHFVTEGQDVRASFGPFGAVSIEF